MNCIECFAEIRAPPDTIDGEILTCRECGTALEVEISETGLLSLKQAEAIAEDWGE